MQNCNDWLANENQFSKGKKIIFSNFTVAASTESLRQAGISYSGYLGCINVDLLSILISISFFFFFLLSVCPPITQYDYSKCGHDKNRYSINSDAMSLGLV